MHLFPIVPTDIKTVPNSSIRHTEHTPLLLENIEFPETEITLTGDPYTIQDKSFDDACIEYVKAKDDYLVWNIGRPSDEILKAFHAISPAPTDEFRWPILYLSNQCFSVSVKAQCCFPKATGVKAGFDDTKFWDVIQRWYHGHEVHPLGEVIKYSHGHKRLSECLALLKMAQAAYHRAYLQKTGRILRECHESMVRSALNQDSRQRHLPLPPARP